MAKTEDVNMQEDPITSEAPKDEGIEKIIAELSERGKKVFNTFVRRQREQSLPVTMGQVAELSNVYHQFLAKLLDNPVKLAAAQLSYWQDYLHLWQSTMMRLAGNTTELLIKPDEKDRRFTDKEWESNPFFLFFRQFYLLTAKHIQKVINGVEGLDEKTAKKLNFYTRQFVDAISPSNFIVTNPEVFRLTLKTGGKNLLKGFENLLGDLERSEGALNIKMTDLKAFKIGKNIAVTPGKVIYQNDLIQLIQYSPQTAQVYRRPLLMIPPWINKYYILDLSADNSMVKWLVENGYTVFMISWVNPSHQFAHIDFEDYMQQGPLAAMDAIEKATGEHEMNALGFCLGGTLLACTEAYMAAKNDRRLKSATYLGTLLDFTDPGDMGVLIDERHIHLLEQAMNKKGYLDGGDMSMTFNLLRANDLIWSYFIKNYLQGEEPFPFDLLYWNSDPTNMPAKMHSTYLRKMYLQNLLVKAGGITLSGVPIDLKKIDIPVYFLSTHFDHIAPWKSTYAGIKLHSGAVTFVLGGSGHVAGVINPPQKNKYCYYTNAKKPADPDAWFENAQEHSGSWWPHWEKWLGKHSGNKVPARIVVKALEDAPGSYVRVSLSMVKEK